MRCGDAGCNSRARWCLAAGLAPLTAARLGGSPAPQSAHLGRNYDTLKVDIRAQPRERDPTSRKCTMPNPNSHSHLRHVTGRKALLAYEQAQQQQQQEGQQQAEVAELPSTSLDPASGAGAASSGGGGGGSGRSLPPGGQLQVLITAKGITTHSLPPAAPDQPTPSMTIVVRGQDLHAPLIERILELPMDIHAGQVSWPVALA